MSPLANAPVRAGGTRRSPGPALLLLPLLVALGVWVYGPVLATVALSFVQWSLTGPPPVFVGLANFQQLLGAPEFGRSVLQTLVYAAALLPFSTLVPLALAVLLWMRPGRSANLYRALIFLPFMVAPVAFALAWQFLLNPLVGAVPAAFEAIGLPRANLLGDPGTAIWAIVVITAPKVVAFNLLLFGAALERIDRRLLEAARVERATPYETVRYVVVPQLIRPVVTLALLSVLLAGQWVFTNVNVLTQGGPSGTTDNVYIRIYLDAFRFFATGRASAAGVLVLAAVLVAVLVQALLRRRRAHA